MVGPGEVDEELEPETAEECEKYGKVARCLIFEVNICFQLIVIIIIIIIYRIYTALYKPVK